MRCFVAIELDPTWRAAIGRLLPGSPGRSDGAKWVGADSLHLTLWFLGEVDTSALPVLAEALRRASELIPPFELSIAGIGGFPSRSHPRVLWIGADDAADGCKRWIAGATPLLSSLGFAPESRPFHAHLTLARARDERGVRTLRAEAETMTAPPIGPLAIHEITLFESAVEKGGPRYQALGRFPLGTDRRAANVVGPGE